jgi:hypothetical protein
LQALFALEQTISGSELLKFLEKDMPQGAARPVQTDSMVDWAHEAFSALSDVHSSDFVALFVLSIGDVLAIPFAKHSDARVAAWRMPMWAFETQERYFVRNFAFTDAPS